MVTNGYIKQFLEKKERGNPLLLKTKYGRQLGEKYAINEHKAQEWLSQRQRSNSLLPGKS